jgi:hypothetical protein
MNDIELYNEDVYVKLERRTEILTEKDDVKIRKLWRAKIV